MKPVPEHGSITDALAADLGPRFAAEHRLWKAYCARFGWEYRDPRSAQRIRRLGRKFRHMVVAVADLGVSHNTLLVALRGGDLTVRLSEALSGITRREWVRMGVAARDAHVAARIAEWQSVDLRVGHGRCSAFAQALRRDKGDLARALRGDKR